MLVEPKGKEKEEEDRVLTQLKKTEAHVCWKNMVCITYKKFAAEN